MMKLGLYHFQTDNHSRQTPASALAIGPLILSTNSKQVVISGVPQGSSIKSSHTEA